jgi:hypothetical protein
VASSEQIRFGLQTEGNRIPFQLQFAELEGSIYSVGSLVDRNANIHPLVNNLEVYCFSFLMAV